MNIREKTFSILAVIMFFVPAGMSSEAIAVDKAPYLCTREESLKGIGGVYVVVDFSNVHENAKRMGLFKNFVQTYVESKLKFAGIKMLTKEESEKEGSPHLYVVVVTYPVGTEESPLNFVFSGHIDIRQFVELYRRPSCLVHTVTWSNYALGYGDVELIGDLIKDLINSFINAYLSVNPKSIERKK